MLVTKLNAKSYPEYASQLDRYMFTELAVPTITNRFTDTVTPVLGVNVWDVAFTETKARIVGVETGESNVDSFSTAEFTTANIEGLVGGIVILVERGDFS